MSLLEAKADRVTAKACCEDVLPDGDKRSSAYETYEASWFRMSYECEVHEHTLTAA
jgi:hypothetical protein